jgi:hypothetical protein
MWENETVVLVTSLKKRILDSKERVRFRDISADDGVPTFVKALFKNRVETYIQKESPLTVQSTPHFDLRPDDLENLKSRFLDVFREAAMFDDKEVETLLKEALVLRMNYLVKPSDTMRRILFENRDSVGLSDVDGILLSFKKELPYAGDVIDECHKLGKTSVTAEDFGQIVTDVLHRSTAEDPVKVVVRDLSALTEFLSETKGEEITRVEGNILQDFLADRNLWGFRRALDVEMKLGRDDFTVADLEVTLKRYLELKEEFSKDIDDDRAIPKDEVKSERVEEKEVKGERQDTIQTKEETLPFEEEKLDLDEVLNEGPPSQETQDIAIKAEAEAEEEPQKPMRIIRRTQKKEETKEEAKLEGPVKEEAATEKKGLREFIDTKSEKVFVKKLFGGDNAEYEQLINKLDEAESWRVAKILIDNELFKRDVDPFSREAIKLVDLVYGLYYPEEGVGGIK